MGFEFCHEVWKLLEVDGVENEGGTGSRVTAASLVSTAMAGLLLLQRKQKKKIEKWEQWTLNSQRRQSRAEGCIGILVVIPLPFDSKNHTY